VKSVKNKLELVGHEIARKCCAMVHTMAIGQYENVIASAEQMRSYRTMASHPMSFLDPGFFRGNHSGPKLLIRRVHEVT
jgi:hypothetical protein